MQRKAFSLAPDPPHILPMSAISFPNQGCFDESLRSPAFSASDERDDVDSVTNCY